MKLPLKIHLRRSATLLLALLLLTSCSLLPLHAEPATTSTAVPSQPAGAATLTPGQAGATATPTADSSSTSPGTLAISDSYPYFTKLIAVFSIAASPGKVWMGTGTGTIEEVDSQSSIFEQSILLASGTGWRTVTPIPKGSAYTPLAIIKSGFEGQYLWALGWLFENNTAHPFLFTVDPGNGTVVHQWDLNSPDWLGNEERRYLPQDFGISPGKIWMDGHVIDTQTFEVTPVDISGMTLFAYNGKGWMWMTGDIGGDCDDLLLGNTDDPSTVWCPSQWPFIIHTQTGEHAVGPYSPLVLAGDRMWIGGGWSGTTPIYTLEAYSADMDLAMNETGPLASVPLMDSYQKIRMLFAGNYLWVVYTHGEKAGFLYQLDPQTGATINSLDLIGDQGRSIGDVPVDIATEGDNLWILTRRQLLRIQLP